MNCPFCYKSDTYVKDSRESGAGQVVRRRRCCQSCGGKFTTVESVQMRKLFVIKRTGDRKPFDSNKVQNSIATALRKRNISDEKIIEVTNRITLELIDNSKETSTKKIGEMIMLELAKIDQVAYIRFASVYKEFSNAQDFAKFASKIKFNTSK